MRRRMKAPSSVNAADTERGFSHLFSYLDNITDLGINFVSLDTSLHVNDASVDSWDKFDPLTIDKDASTLSLPSLPSPLAVFDSPARGVFPIRQSDKKRKRRTPPKLWRKRPNKRKKKQPKKKQKEEQDEVSLLEFDLCYKTPKYVVQCGDDPPRYGVKMKLCNQNVRIGCNYIDMCSAGHVALEAKKQVILTSSNTFKLRENNNNNNNKPLVRVSVYIRVFVIIECVTVPLYRHYTHLYHKKISRKATLKCKL